MSCTPLAESAWTAVLTLHPVASSNGVTQSYSGRRAAALRVAGPDDQVQFALARTKRRQWRRRRQARHCRHTQQWRRRARPRPATSSSSSLVLLHLAPVRDGELVLSLPDEADSLAFLGERLGRGRREILLGDDQLRARIERDPVPGVRAEIGDSPNATARGSLVITDRRLLARRDGSSRVGS